MRSGSNSAELQAPPQLPIERELGSPGANLADPEREDSLHNLHKVISQHTLLTREQEQVFTFQVRDQKQLCEQLLFQSPAIIQLALQELRTLNAPKRGRTVQRDSGPVKQRAYKVIVFETGSDKPLGGEVGAVRRVTLNLRTVEKLVDRMESLAGVLTDPAVSSVDKRKAKIEFDARRERIARLLTECRFRRALFKRFYNEFKKQVCEERNSDASKAQHFRAFWESRSELDQRLHRVEEHSALYEQARKKLVKSNLRLVLKEAGKWATYPVPFVDLFQSGIPGLCTAIDLFDPDKGWKLSTYATNWIRQAIRLCAKNSNDLIPKNSHIETMCQSVSSLIMDFVAMNGREPSDQEIAEELGMKQDIVVRVREIIAPVVSIEGSFSRHKTDETPVAKTLCAPENDLSHEVDFKVESAQLREALQLLPERQRLCVALRHNLLSTTEKESLERHFGVDIDVDPSLPSLGKLFRVSTQRIAVVYREGLAAVASHLLGVDSVSQDDVKLIIDRFSAASRATR